MDLDFEAAYDELSKVEHSEAFAMLLFALEDAEFSMRSIPLDESMRRWRNRATIALIEAKQKMEAK